MKAELGLSLLAGEGDEELAEAVATVACDLVCEGVFLPNAMPAAAGEVEKFLVVCLRARAALPAGFVRSIF